MSIKLAGFAMCAMIFPSYLAWAGSNSSNITPMVDGQCKEYTVIASKSIDVSEAVKLYIYQDQHYVWFCYTYPSGSYGILDLTLDTKKLAEPYILHVSAQIGEWPLNKAEEMAPDHPESDRWWNAKGWVANPVWVNGIDKSGKEPRYRLKNAPAREIQLSKERFGAGEWELLFEISMIKSSDKGYYSLTFPKNEKPYRLMVR